MIKIEVLDKTNIQVVKIEGKTFNGKGFKNGWAMFVEGMGYMGFEGSNVPYVLDTKKYMKVVRDGWGTEWDFVFIQED